ncbi:MAG: threonine synthase [Chloroflexi bacterium]|nr:threonine synthase [Chloroflexota bacterium]
MNLTCIECGKTYGYDSVRYRCDCGGLIEASHDLDRAKKYSPGDFPASFITGAGGRPSGVWRYKILLPPVPESDIITRGEGGTGLYLSEKVTDYAGLPLLFLKHEGENPTGSFKDRGMTVGVSMANHLGFKKVGCASTGNTSASLACYAALCGMSCIVIIPEGKIAEGKLSQALAYGAKTYQVRGDFDKAMGMIQEYCDKKGVYLLNSLNPYRLEGQKTIIFELMEQMKWKAPDWLVTPGGNLGNTSAFHKAFMELLSIGWISKIPRFAVIQAEGAAPLYNAYKSGFKSFEPVEAHTIATAIRIGNPVNYAKARRAITQTGGLVEKVTDEEILDAKAVIDGAGIGCEPASAAALAGAKKLAAAGVMKSGEKIVCILTGSLLKDPSTTVDYHLGGHGNRFANPPVVIDSLEEIA